MAEHAKRQKELASEQPEAIPEVAAKDEEDGKREKAE